MLYQKPVTVTAVSRVLNTCMQLHQKPATNTFLREGCDVYMLKARSQLGN